MHTLVGQDNKDDEDDICLVLVIMMLTRSEITEIWQDLNWWSMGQTTGQCVGPMSHHEVSMRSHLIDLMPDTARST
jgi:alanyl-tRNA synthetase